MPNGLKTALLLGLTERTAAGDRRPARRRERTDHRVHLRGRDELRLVLVLGQDRPAHVLARRRSAPGTSCTGSSSGSRQRASLPMPKVYIIPDPSPNAFATGRNPSHAAVAATEGILQVLERARARRRHRARAGAREAPRHPHQLVAATIAAAIMMVARMAHVRRHVRRYGGRDDRDRGNNPIALLATMILAPMAAMLIQMAISRSREFAADAGGRRDRRQSVRAGRRAAEDRRGRRSACRSTPTRPRRTCSS